jgi:hypothetical protein
VHHLSRENRGTIITVSEQSPKACLIYSSVIRYSDTPKTTDPDSWRRPGFRTVSPADMAETRPESGHLPPARSPRTGAGLAGVRFPALFSEKQSQSENGSHVHTLVYSLQATESTGVVSTVSGAGRWRACHVVCVTACATVSRFGVVCVCVILVSDPCVQEHHDTHSHSHLMLEPYC